MFETVADWLVRALLVATFFVLLLGPESRWGGPLAFLCFLVTGLWAILYPEGLLSWVKKFHPSLDVGSIRWVPRLVGGVALFVLLLAVLATNFWR